MAQGRSLSSSPLPFFLLPALVLLLTSWGSGSAMARTLPPALPPAKDVNQDSDLPFAGLQTEKIQMWFRDLTRRVSTAFDNAMQGHTSDVESVNRRALAGYGSFQWPTPTGHEHITSTQVITGTFNGDYKMYTGFGNGGQAEGQACMFLLQDGATIENVIIGPPAADGIHCLGSCTLRNVYWTDVGEDAATFRGGSPSDVMLIEGGAAAHAADKVFMTDGQGTLIIRNFYAVDIGKLVRSCGNCKSQFQRHIEIDNVAIEDARNGVVSLNVDYGDTAKISRVRLVGMTLEKCPVCIRTHSGKVGHEPVKLGSGPDGTNCIYSESTIIVGGPQQLPDPNWSPSSRPSNPDPSTPSPPSGYPQNPSPSRSHKHAPPSGYRRDPPPSDSHKHSPPPSGYPRHGSPDHHESRHPPQHSKHPPHAPRHPNRRDKSPPRREYRRERVRHRSHH